MWILMVEAGVALFLLVFIVWWTMYSGRKPDDHAAGPQAGRTERPRAEAAPENDTPDA